MPWTIRNVRVYDRFVLIASEGGVTFWTGNHPLAIGEGDLAANPAIKQAEIEFRAAHPGLTPEALEPLYYRDALAYIIGAPGLVGAPAGSQGVLHSSVPMGPSYALHSTRYRVASVGAVPAPAAVRSRAEPGASCARHRSRPRLCSCWPAPPC